MREVETVQPLASPPTFGRTFNATPNRTHHRNIFIPGGRVSPVQIAYRGTACSVSKQVDEPGEHAGQRLCGRHNAGANGRTCARLQEGRSEHPIAPGQPAPSAVVLVGPIAQHAVHQQLGGAERQPHALPGERVDISGRVADQQRPARHTGAHSLPQWSRRPVLTMGVAGNAIAELAEGFEVTVEAPAGGAEDRDPDAIVGHRRHICLSASRPVHLDRIGPRRDLEMPTDPPPARAHARHRKPQSFADR